MKLRRAIAGPAIRACRYFAAVGRTHAWYDRAERWLQRGLRLGRATLAPDDP